MSKVNMEELPIFLKHGIARVPITDAKDVGCNYVPSSGTNEILTCNLEFLVILTVGFQEVVDW
jgi:hypothetical protein